MFKIVAKSELEVYLEDNKLRNVENYDVLGFSKVNKSRFLVLSQMAKRYFSHSFTYGCI